MRDSALSPAQVILESRQQCYTARLANVCRDKLRKQHQDSSSVTPVCRAVKEEYKHGRPTEGMNWPAPGEKSVVKTIILDNTTAAERATPRWERETAANVVAGIWTWWIDRSRSDDSRVGAAAVRMHRDEWRSCRS